MIKQMYAVFDSKSQAYCNPFLAPREEIAIRDFTRAARDPSLEISQFPEDFSLQHLGSFDDTTGKFEILLNPVPVVTALNCKE